MMALFTQNTLPNQEYHELMKPNLREAQKFLDLCWNDQIYKNSDLKHDELAVYLGFESYYYSIQMCKNYFDLTFEKFFKHCRVAEIKQFLAQPESRKYELLEVSRKLGYPHRSNFNRHFKSVTNISPREFWYFHEHFVETMGITLVEYEEPDTTIYVPEDGTATFLSNFLNKKAAKLNYHNKNEPYK